VVKGAEKLTAPSASRPPAKKRRPERRDQILEIAVRLFHQRGFHATGMDDIGEEAGITGPAIYRHFDSKEDILLAATEAWTEHRFAEIDEIVATSSSPRETLERLARDHARATVAQPSLSAVILAERRTLAPDARASLERVIRLRIEAWIHALKQMRPELSDAEASVMVFAVFTLMASVTQYDSGLDPELVEELLVDMAMKSLLQTPV
jgi:AcrR family transcriptional regulator